MECSLYVNLHALFASWRESIEKVYSTKSDGVCVRVCVGVGDWQLEGLACKWAAICLKMPRGIQKHKKTEQSHEF